MVVRYSLYFIVMALYTAPLLGIMVMPPAFLLNWKNGAVFLLVIHEFSGFLFFGHTLFSNIWAMCVRNDGRPCNGCDGPRDAAQDGARHHCTDIDIEPTGGTPAGKPLVWRVRIGDVKTAAIRGIGSTILTFYIIWCMVTKNALFI